MVDSSAKLVTGVLYGNTVDLGNFDECIQSSSPHGFSGRYMLPYLDVQVGFGALNHRAEPLQRLDNMRPPLTCVLLPGH